MPLHNLPISGASRKLPVSPMPHLSIHLSKRFQAVPHISCRAIARGQSDASALLRAGISNRRHDYAEPALLLQHVTAIELAAVEEVEQ
jgi:hypothetical protein